MATQHEGGDIFHGDAKFVREKVAEACAVQHAGHAANLACGQAGELLQGPDHRVERVGDTDDKGVGRVVANALPNRFHDLEIDAQQIIAAHPGLARDAGRHDAHIGASDVRVILRAFQVSIKPLRWPGFSDIERFALRNSFGDVEHDHIPQFLKRCEMGECTPDLSGAYQGDFGSGHTFNSDWFVDQMASPKDCGVQVRSGGRARLTFRGILRYVKNFSF